MVEKKKKIADLLRFFSFYVNNLTLSDNLKSFSHILFKFVMYVTYK